MTGANSLHDEFEPEAVQLIAQDDRRNEQYRRQSTANTAFGEKEEPEQDYGDERNRFSVQVCDKWEDEIEERIAEPLIQDPEELTINLKECVHHLVGDMIRRSGLRVLFVGFGLLVQKPAENNQCHDHKDSGNDSAVSREVRADELPVLTQFHARVQEQKIPYESADK